MAAVLIFLFFILGSCSYISHYFSHEYEHFVKVDEPEKKEKVQTESWYDFFFD